MKPGAHRAIAGIALLELLVSATVVAVVGAMVAGALQSAFSLFARNVAVNAPHQEARVAIARLTADLHASASPLQLVDAQRQPVAQPGPAAGIAFQRLVAGPFRVVQDAAAGAQEVVLDTGTAVVTPRQRLIIPSHRIEAEIVAVTGSGAATTVRLSTPLGTAIVVPAAPAASNSSGPNAVVAHLTQRACYVVAGGELLLHPDRAADAHLVLARHVTSATPFRLPPSSGATAELRPTAEVSLATIDPRSSNRGYRSTSMRLDTVVAQRNRLTIFQ